MSGQPLSGVPMSEVRSVEKVKPTVDEVLKELRKRAVALPMGATCDASLCHCSEWNAYRWAQDLICNIYSDLRDAK
jgi:hypothetical protein